MKKLTIVLLVMLFAFSGCYYNYSDDEVKKMRDEWSEQYYELEEESFRKASRIEKLETDLSRTENYIYTLYDYFEEGSVSFEEAREAYDSLHDILSSYY